MIINDLSDFWFWTSVKAKYKLLCTMAANGDYFQSLNLYENEDYADVFEHYVYNSCRGK
jgi:hypothetical protein